MRVFLLPLFFAAAMWLFLASVISLPVLMACFMVVKGCGGLRSGPLYSRVE